MISGVAAVLACLSLATQHSLVESHSLRAYTHKDISTSLANIEERLKVLDVISSGQAKQARRLDIIQDKLDRLENTLSLRLDRVQLAAERLEHRLHMLQVSIQASIKEHSQQIIDSQLKICDFSQELTSNIDTQRNLLDKTSGTFTELTKRSEALETLMRDSQSLVNATRRELADGLKNIAAITRRQSGTRMFTWQTDLDTLLSKRLSENSQKIDVKVQEMIDTQKSFFDSCQRIQEDEPDMADVITKLVDSIYNKTADTFRELQNIHSAIRSHDSKMKMHLVGRTAQTDITCRRLETAFRNASQSTLKENEVQQLTEKFVTLTDRADAALQKLEARLAYDNEETGEMSDITAEADSLFKKLNEIKNENEPDDDKTWEDADQDNNGFYDDSIGADIMKEDMDILDKNPENTAEKETELTRPPHQRHLHKHPYDRGPITTTSAP